jgi:putative flippase GtrA
MPYSGGMLALLDWLVDALPGPMRRYVVPAHVRLLAQFMQFGVVGVAGFLADTAVVYATRDMAGLYVAGTLAYAVAVTVTWWLNRIWTFRGAGAIGSVFRQWLIFAAANLPGLCLNLGTYFVLVTVVPVCAVHPILAIAAGALAGMFANFTLSRAMVFR